MAAISNTCAVCSGSGLIGDSICGTCIGSGVVPAKGMPKYVKETLDGIALEQKIHLELLEKILAAVGPKKAMGVVKKV